MRASRPPQQRRGGVDGALAVQPVAVDAAALQTLVTFTQIPVTPPPRQYPSPDVHVRVPRECGGMISFSQGLRLPVREEQNKKKISRGGTLAFACLHAREAFSLTPRPGTWLGGAEPFCFTRACTYVHTHVQTSIFLKLATLPVH